ncbi:histidine kinase [Clostridiales bacterium PH28_bin88]|nr:histidine kinase [Clostridiales bacterium PH28_bin88]
MSIRWRLTLFFTAVLALTLLAFGLFLYLLMDYNLNAEVNRAASRKADEVLRSIRIVGLPLSTQRVVLPDVDVFASPDTYLQVVDTYGEVVARSANLGHQALPITPASLSAVRVGKEFYETVRVGREALRLYYQPLIFQGEIIGILQVGRSLRSLETAMVRLRWLLILGSGLTVFLAGTTGWWLARAALRPIDRIASAAGAIQEARDLGRRIQYDGPPDEVGRLAGTFNEMLGRLQAAYQHLEEAYAAQRRFVADASHELRTPLTTIRGNVDFLRKMGDADPAERAEVLRDIAGETERMSRLVSDLLALARADAGQHPDKRPVEIRDLLNEVARQARIMAGQVEFRVEGTGELAGVQVLGSEDHLKQLFLILLDNAFKYTQTGGMVTLSAATGEGRLVVQVEDTGVGIAMEDLPHVFDRFYRADKARQAGGSGLGLAIAKWIVEEHDGEIEAESVLGEGSIFQVWLPVNNT